MKWQLTDVQRVKVRECINAIEYPPTADGEPRERREKALLRLKLFIEGDRLLVQGVARAFHASILPLLYSIVQEAGAETGPGSASQHALALLGDIVAACSRKQAAALLMADRFRSLAEKMDGSDRDVAVLSARVIATLLKIEESVKELFWELNLHQIVRRAITRMLGDLRSAARQGAEQLRSLCPLRDSLLDVLIHSAATSRHRQELYGSGYGLCAALLQCTVDLCPWSETESAADGTGLGAELTDAAEKLVLACAHLIRENKLNQDIFRQQPNLGLLTSTLRHLCGPVPAPGACGDLASPSVRLRLALEVLSLSLQYCNEGARRIILQEAPAAQVSQELHAFQNVLLEGLENLRRHHYDVDVVVSSLRQIEEKLIHTDAAVQKSYLFRNTYGAWSLLCLCMNNIDERIMFQACCLTCTLVRDCPENQHALINLDGIETLSDILGDYNLDIQLVGMRILEALKASGSERMKREVGDPSILEHLLRVVKEFPAVFTQIVNAQPHWGARDPQGSHTPNVTTPLNPNPYDLTKLPNLEKQVSIVEHAISLVGGIVVHCPQIRPTLLEMCGEQALLQLLTYSYSYCYAFYSSIREQSQAGGKRGSAGSAAALLRLPRAQTAPGPRRTDGDGDGTCPRGRDGDDSGTAASPIKKLSSLYIKTLLGVVEVTSCALSNVVRQLQEAQNSFHQHGGTDVILQFLTCLLTFSEDLRQKQEHEAWGGCAASSDAPRDEAGFKLRVPHEIVSRLCCDDHGDELDAIEHGTTHFTGIRTPGDPGNGVGHRRSFICQNGWLVGPELLASIILLAVNAVEANAALQAALRQGRLRLLVHYLLSHQSSVVVNSAMLLVSHLCFNNPENQTFLATPWAVERIAWQAVHSYCRLVHGLHPPAPGMSVEWGSVHLHKLTPPADSDPRSFFAFQGLAYSLNCLATLLQHNKAAREAVYAAEIHTADGVVPWAQLLAYCMLTPCYPVQDAALLLLKNLLRGEGEPPEEVTRRLVALKIVDCLIRLVCMDRSADDQPASQPPSPSQNRSAEMKWLSNTAFQLLASLPCTSTQVVLAHVTALVDSAAAYPDPACQRNASSAADMPFVVPAEMYAELDEIDVYNALTEYMPVLNGLVYTAEEARRTCLRNGGAAVIAALCSRQCLDMDLKVCAVYVLANVATSSSSCGLYSLLDAGILTSLSRVVSHHHVSPRADEDPEEHAVHLEEMRLSLLQLTSGLVMSATPAADGRPGRVVLVQSCPEVVTMATVCFECSSRVRKEAVSFLLALCEDDDAAAALRLRHDVMQVFEETERQSQMYSHGTMLQVKKQLRAQ